MALRAKARNLLTVFTTCAEHTAICRVLRHGSTRKQQQSVPNRWNSIIIRLDDNPLRACVEPVTLGQKLHKFSDFGFVVHQHPVDFCYTTEFMIPCFLLCTQPSTLLIYSQAAGTIHFLLNYWHTNDSCSGKGLPQQDCCRIHPQTTNLSNVGLTA